MSNVKKTVKLTESKLVEVIEDVAKKVIATEKKKWIMEQRKIQTSILESRIAAIEKKINESKK